MRSGIKQARVRRQSPQVRKGSGWSLYDETPVIEVQRAKPSKLLASSRSSRTTMKTARHHVAVPRVLTANRRINHQPSPMHVADSKHHPLSKRRVVREN